MSRIVLEKPVRIKYLIKTDDIDAFNKTVDDIEHNRFTQLYQGDYRYAGRIYRMG